MTEKQNIAADAMEGRFLLAFTDEAGAMPVVLARLAADADGYAIEKVVREHPGYRFYMTSGRSGPVFLKLGD